MDQQVVQPGRGHIVTQRLQRLAEVAIGQCHLLAREIAADVRAFERRRRIFGMVAHKAHL